MNTNSIKKKLTQQSLNCVTLRKPSNIKIQFVCFELQETNINRCICTTHTLNKHLHRPSYSLFCFVLFLSVIAFDFCPFCVVTFGCFIPATTANDLRLRRIFYPRFYPLHLFSYLNSWERASSFPFECWVLNKDTTGTIFITSLVWRGPWLGIEPGTSRTRSQHYTTRLSRRRLCANNIYFIQCNWNSSNDIWITKLLLL